MGNTWSRQANSDDEYHKWLHEGKIPDEWLTKVLTSLIMKDETKGAKRRNYRPITPLLHGNI